MTATYDEAAETYRFAPIPHQGSDVSFPIEIGLLRSFWDGLWKTGPLKRLLESQITPNWHVGHPYTEELLNHMLMERASWVRKLLDKIEADGLTNGTDAFPITVQVVGDAIGEEHLAPLSRLPLEYAIGDDQRIYFRVRGDYLTDPVPPQQVRRLRRNGIEYSLLVLADGGALDASIRAGNPGGFKLRTGVTISEEDALDLRSDDLRGALVIRLMQEIHALEEMRNCAAALAYWQNVEAQFGRYGFQAFCVGDFFGGTSDIYRAIWGRDLITNNQLSVEDRLTSGLMVGITALTGGVPGSSLAGKGFKVLRQGVSQDVLMTARANMTGLADSVLDVVDDLAHGGTRTADAVVDVVRRTADRGTRFAQDALEAGLMNVDRLISLPTQILIKVHSGLGRLGPGMLVRSGSQAPHVNSLRGLARAARSRVPHPIAVRRAPTYRATDAVIGAVEDAAHVRRILAANVDEADQVACASAEDFLATGGCFTAGTPVLLADGSW
ncbi:MAG: pre-toxin TG domain-containing protein, partial [Planctomycetes bacterium]|nr:pre-toxin TG domain-containing protein [Planctomycetota bacterium]